MALTFDPFGEMDRLATQLLRSNAAQARGPRWMPMDLYRSGDHYVVNIDLPGVDPGSIDLDVDGGTLTVRAERTVATQESAQWLAQERPAGSFMRQLALGDGLDVQRIHAMYENGVLSLTVPVAEAAKPRKIQVQTGRGQQQIRGASEETIEAESRQTSAGGSKS